MFQSINYIIRSKHLVKSGNPKDWITQCLDNIFKNRGVKIEVREQVKGSAVIARVYNGHWIADCDVCKGAMFVDPDYPFFFCCECFNRSNDGCLRPIQFPNENDRLEIEKLLLERPVNDIAGVTDSERAGRALPILYQEFADGSTQGLLRNWEPQETIENLKEQNKLVEKWKKATKKGGR